jgi:hypothetical protein
MGNYALLGIGTELPESHVITGGLGVTGRLDVIRGLAL